MQVDPEIAASMVNASATVVSTLLAAITAALIGKKIAGRNELLEELELAMQDINFLLAVEQTHCELHKANSSESNLRRVRQHVRARGLTWSGQFTPGRQLDRRGRK